MNKSLSIFMGLVLTVGVLVSLYYGLAYQSLKLKHEHHVELVDQFQVKQK